MFQRFEQYLLTEKRFSDHTLQAYVLDVSQFFSFARIEFTDLQTISASLVRSWIVELFDQGMSRKSINRKLSSLRTYFKWLKKEGVLTGNPMSKVNGPKNEKRLPQFARETELRSDRLDNLFTDDFDGLRDRLMLEMFYQTGMRLSELIGLKDADVQADRVRVLGKRNKERLIPLSEGLLELVQSYREAKAFVAQGSASFFVLKNGNKLYPKFVYRKINGYLACVTNLEKTSPHVLRHTFATHMLNNGAGLETLKDLLGHASLSATQVYTHNSFAQLSKIYSQAHPRGRKN